jgi:hypothetical protein
VSDASVGRRAIRRPQSLQAAISRTFYRWRAPLAVIAAFAAACALGFAAVLGLS